MDKEFIVYAETKASFEAAVTSGDVDTSQIGIIGETGELWENGEYHPLVESISLARDLTGREEATAEEFIFRASGGNKSIRDESAVIRRIKGNTLVWNQLAYNTKVYNFGGVSYTFGENDVVTASGTLTGESSRFGCAHLQKNHYYYHRVEVIDMGECSEVYVGNLNEYYGRKLFNSPGIYEKINKRTGITSNSIIGIIRASDTDVNVTGLKVSYQCIDLTQLFRAGNEPSTVEEFRELYPDSYYPYCEPEVRSMRATGIETIGANAFDKNSVVGGLINADGTVTSNDIYSVAKIEIVPYEKYTLTNVANAANTTYTYALYDSEDRFISVGEIKNSVTKPVSVSGDVTMPLNARYIRVVVHNDYLDSCCVNLKHSGTLTAEEATYFKEVRMLPDIAKYFPDGMHGIGEVYDEINEENAVKRFGVRAYEDGDNDNADVITDGTNTVYVLDEPIVTPITEPLQWDYKVADFGTEKMLSNLPSSPFRADIVYQFNAADRIRDNARNIERLEEHTKDMATRDYVIEKIPTTIATATERVTTWPSDDRLVANVLVDVSSVSQGTAAYSILGFDGGSSDYSFDDVWRVRFAGLSSALNISPTIYWVNGQAPSFDTWAICDIEFRRTPNDSIFGEWKIYR